MQRKVFAAFVVATLFPVLAFAFTQEEAQVQINALNEQIAKLQEQLATTSASTVTPAVPTAAPSSTPRCPIFTRTLSKGASGDAVLQLQKILKSGGYLHVEPTGYFGSLTEKALQEYQASARLVSSGSPATTGWGVFGPKTRANFAQLCAQKLASLSAAQTSGTCPLPPSIPATTCPGSWQRLTDNAQCHVGWQCVRASSVSGNQPPRVDAIDGPTTLTTNQYGAWTVSASDPENGALSYSVVWGDEDIQSLLSLVAGLNTAVFSSVSRLVHYFTKAGMYTPEVTVRDPAGNIALSNFTVSVITASSTGLFTSSLPFGGVSSTPASQSQCEYHGSYYAQGTQTEGLTVNDLCLSTGGVCMQRTSYVPTFICKFGRWESAQEPPPNTNLRLYGNVVGSRCAPAGSKAVGATTQVMVVPGTQLCRDFLCATSQNYATVTLTCEYEVWIDWGIFSMGTTTSSVCTDPTPCEYNFGDVGKACAAKQNGLCPTPRPGH